MVTTKRFVTGVFFIIALLVLLLIVASVQGKSDSKVYFPAIFSGSSGPTITILPSDIIAGGCWSIDRCAYLVSPDKFTEVSDAGAIQMDDMVFGLVGKHSFLLNTDFEDFLWCEEGKGVWILRNHPNEYIQFR